jgi:hypothetical protein
MAKNEKRINLSLVKTSRYGVLSNLDLHNALLKVERLHRLHPAGKIKQLLKTGKSAGTN